MVYSNGKEALVTGINAGLKVVTSGALDILDGQSLKIAAAKAEENE